MQLTEISLLVENATEAIQWLTDCLKFEVFDTKESDLSATKMRQSGSAFILNVVQAKNTRERIAVGNQFAGHIGFVLSTNTFEDDLKNLKKNKLRMAKPTECEKGLKSLIFQDLWGNKWMLKES